MFSVSKVGCYEQCPFKYSFRYLDELETYPDTSPDNPLILGTALHTGIEEGLDKAIQYYKSNFPIMTDETITEIIKLENWIPKVRKLIPDGEFEVKIICDDYIGFIDLVHENEDGSVDLYDFKYAGNPDRYRNSEQLSIYAYYYNKVTGKKVNKLCYVIVPKTNLRQYKAGKRRKRDETIEEFRKRVKEDMAQKEITFVEVEMDYNKVAHFLSTYIEMLNCARFERRESPLCNWCEYKRYCKEGEDVDIMNLPSCERRKLDYSEKKKIWVYGAPFSGKTVFADKFPNPLMLNTDGNIHNVTAPYIPIKDEVTVSGRITNRKFAWAVFKEAILELEKGGNDFKTIVVDLTEDLYEYCRLYMYDQLGIEHESDDSFRAWDKVRTEFFSTIKRFMNLDYENLILISHEDTSTDITKKGGDKVTAIRPNIQPKIANKIAGMVDIVVRAIAEGDSYTLNFTKSEVVFGGGRLNVKTDKIPNSYDELCKVYEEANEKAVKKDVKKVTKSNNGKSERKSERKEVKEAHEEVEETVKDESETVEEVKEATEEVEEVEEVEETEPEPKEEPKKVRRTRKKRGE